MEESPSVGSHVVVLFAIDGLYLRSGPRDGLGKTTNDLQGPHYSLTYYMHEWDGYPDLFVF